MAEVKLGVNKDKLTIEEGADTFIGKLITGAKGKITIKTPFGSREVSLAKAAEKRDPVEKPAKKK